jgi:hypothetical protein
MTTNQLDVAGQIRGALGLITEEDTAKVLLLTSVGTLATWRSQKTGPQYVKLGKRVFYTINQLGTWINERAAAQVEAHNAAIAA